jgi:uncharacterized protein (UPF0335 family)
MIDPTAIEEPIFLERLKEVARWLYSLDTENATAARDEVLEAIRRIESLEKENSTLPAKIAEIINAGIDDGTFREALLNAERIAELEANATKVALGAARAIHEGTSAERIASLEARLQKVRALCERWESWAFEAAKERVTASAAQDVRAHAQALRMALEGTQQ